MDPSSRKTRTHRVRRAHALVGYWETGGFVLRNYISDRRVRIEPIIARVLDRFDSYTGRERAMRILDGVPRAENLLEQLLAQDILLREGSELDRRDRELQETWRWGQETRLFHFGTRDVPFEEDIETQRESLLRLMCEEPPPGPFRQTEGDRTPLAGEFTDLGRPLGKTLLGRRTRRSFLSRELPFELFGRVMRWTWGRTHLLESGEIGPYILKTSPSGGARHSIEVFPIVRGVENLEPGVYHYSVRDHAVVPCGEMPTDSTFEDIFPGQPWTAEAPVMFIMVARVERSDWKYRHGHAYRVLLLDAGHLGQTFHLVCTALGLAPFTLAGFNDSELERTLGIDGIAEIPLYAAACGYAADSRPGHPSEAP